jgi:ADP-ribose pyrophosphatase YjhB (NUDIX family)
VSGLRLAALRGFYRAAFHVLRLTRLWPRRGRGVKCVLTHGDELLLVRHTYGPRGNWQLPGGTARSGETSAQTAAREMHEELQLSDLDWRELTRTDQRLGRVRVALACMTAEVPDATVRPDPVELECARWFTRAELPARLIGEDRRLLGLLDGWGQ